MSESPPGLKGKLADKARADAARLAEMYSGQLKGKGLRQIEKPEDVSNIGAGTVLIQRDTYRPDVPGSGEWEVERISDDGRIQLVHRTTGARLSKKNEEVLQESIDRGVWWIK
jgi:hypothetical protein